MPTDTPRFLTCWKEIANYLGKGIRTVQRWERELGLPIQRPPSRRSGIVRALTSELDTWMRAQQTGDGENSETAWLLARIEKLQAENEILRRAVSTLLARQPFQPNRQQVDIPIELLWERSVQLLMANISERQRHNELIEQARHIRSLIRKLPPPRTFSPGSEQSASGDHLGLPQYYSFRAPDERTSRFAFLRALETCRDLRA